MNTWRIAGALIVAGAVLAGPAVAQTTSPSADPSKDKPKGSMAGKQEQVKAVQQALKDKGHDPGEIDGVMGPKTQAAVKDFQSKEGLTASGQLDAETMSKLGVQAKAGAATDTGASSPSASPGAPSTPGAGTSGATTPPSGTKK